MVDGIIDLADDGIAHPIKIIRWKKIVIRIII
jgi:hypothetical protein